MIPYTNYPYLDSPEPKKEFKKRLDRDIRRYNRSGLPKYPVYVCSNTDPCQVLERDFKYALYTIRRLGENDFPIIIVTKNPSMLLNEEYLKALSEANSLIQVTIPALDKRFEPGAPPPAERIRGVEELIRHGFIVVVRVDPIIPTYGRVRGQGEDEIEELVEILAGVGVEYIISKVLHLVNPKRARSPIHDRFYEELKPLYDEMGFRISPTTMLLNLEERKKLVSPVFRACRKYGIKTMFTCSDPAFFEGCKKCDGVEEILKLQY
jgi:DNA repair photolyase